jgi:hypothetical protein
MPDAGDSPTGKETDRTQALAAHTEDGAGEYLTTSTGVRIQHTDDSLKAGPRGPTLMEDFHLREKMTHFDHERTRSAPCTHAGRRPTATSRYTSRWPSSRAHSSSTTRP